MTYILIFTNTRDILVIIYTFFAQYSHSCGSLSDSKSFYKT